MAGAGSDDQRKVAGHTTTRMVAEVYDRDRLAAARRVAAATRLLAEAERGFLMARSPIEIMIDQACGFVPNGNPKPPLITLRCPNCKRTKSAPIDPTDPPGTAIVEATCDQCNDGSGFPEVHYFNKRGLWFDGLIWRKPKGEA